MRIIRGLPPKGCSFVALDLEAFNLRRSQLHRPHGRFASLAVAVDPKTVYVITKESQVGPLFDRIGNARKVYHNAGFDVPHLRRWCDFDDHPIDKFWDTLIIERILYAGWYDSFELGDLARRHLGKRIFKEVRKKFYESENPQLTEEMIEYNARDALNTWLIAQKQIPLLDADPQSKRVWEWIDGPAFWAIEAFKGVKLNLKKWDKLADHSLKEAARLKDELGFNPASSKQTLAALSERRIILDSSNALLLEHYRDDPIVAKILKFREAQKLATTYGKNYHDFVEEDGRIYSKFGVNVAVTGRMNSSGPNLQQAPKEDAYRECFEADTGNVFISGDYASQEPRISAALADDKRMLEILNDGGSPYPSVAEILFGIPPSKLSKKSIEYRRAKAVVLGTDYGLTPYGLSEREGITKEEAEKLIHDYLDSFPDTASYMARIKINAKTDGLVRSMGGRRMYINTHRKQWENAPLNWPVQSSGADIIKRAAVRIYEKTGRKNCPLNMLIHDEIDAEVSKKDGAKTAKLIQSCMEEGFKDIVGDVVKGESEVHIGRTWAG